MKLHILSARALVFDFDGVIYDSERLWMSVLKAMYANHDVVFPENDFIESIGGTSADFDPFAELADRAKGVNAATLASEGQKEFEMLAFVEEPAQGVVNLVQTARSSGMLLAIASNSTLGSVHRYLNQVDLLKYFAAVVTKDENRRPKPYPDVYQAALEALGCVSNEAMAFEDSRRGIEAARSAGLTTVSVPTALSRHQLLIGAHHTVRSLSDVVIASGFHLAATQIEERKCQT